MKIWEVTSDEKFENWLREHGICHPDIHESIPCSIVPLLISYAIEETLDINFELELCKEQPDTEEAHDSVNHPSHYETGKFECFDVMREIFGDEYMKGFCLGNAFKYLYRCKNKHDSPIEDIKKCRWYLNRYIMLDSQMGG